MRAGWPKQTGFTLVEMVVVMAIAMVLATTVMPSLQTMVQRNRMVSLHNDLVSSLSMARSTAITRASNAVVCPANDPQHQQCLNNGGNGQNVTEWEHGWLVFEDTDEDGLLDADETLVAVRNEVPTQVSLISNAPFVRYDGDGTLLSPPLEFTFCNKQENVNKNGLLVTESGTSRSISAERATGSCP